MTYDLTGKRVGLYCRVSIKKDFNAEQQQSTRTQEAIGRQWAEDNGATVVDVYRDDGISAFTKKDRAEYIRMQSDVEAGKLDVIWYWEQSRITRRPGVWHALVELCEDYEVMLCNRDSLIDPHDPRDTLLSGIMSNVDHMESALKKQRVVDGKAAARTAGRPPGGIPYGYVRRYDPRTKAFVSQDPNEWDGDGRPVEDTPAYVVREIFERLAAGESMRSIRLDLEDRGIPTSTGNSYWTDVTVRAIATNPAYIGRQTYKRKIVEDVTPLWPALVSEDVFWAVQRILTNPERSKWRPARARYLLTTIVRCGKCDGPLVGGQQGPGQNYVCVRHGCVGVKAADLDAFVEKSIVAWLAHPDTEAALNVQGDPAAAAQARADRDRARVELEEWRQYIDSGDISPADFARARKRLDAQIAEASRRESAAARPPLFTDPDRVGPKAEATWNDPDRTPLEVKRQIIQAVADIRLHAAGRGRRVAVRDRIEWRWLLDPDSEPILPLVTNLPVVMPIQVKEEKVLVELANSGLVPQRELAKRTGLETYQVSKALERLMMQGLVDRRGNHRSYVLWLTDKGREVAGTLNDGRVVEASPPKVQIVDSHARALRELGNNGGLTNSELAQRLGLSSKAGLAAAGNSVTRRLVEYGYVTRRDPHKEGVAGRAPATFELTDAGRQALADSQVSGVPSDR